jgi:hypothetical protein
MHRRIEIDWALERKTPKAVADAPLGARGGPQTLSRNLHRRDLIRASMVLIFLAFGYQKWFAYEAQVLIPYISNGPLIFWLYPVFGIRGASWFLGVSEWLFGATFLDRAMWYRHWHCANRWR